jgi:hypothetical protein
MEGQTALFTIGELFDSYLEAETDLAASGDGVIELLVGSDVELISQEVLDMFQAALPIVHQDTLGMVLVNSSVMGHPFGCAHYMMISDTAVPLILRGFLLGMEYVKNPMLMLDKSVAWNEILEAIRLGYHENGTTMEVVVNTGESYE